MRIVAGEMRGRTITPPSNFSARPTTDFAKENLFNILANRYDFGEVTFLDLFSGTGSISYEAASRGAQRVVSVELNAQHMSFIKEMVHKLGLDGLVQCVGSNVLSYLQGKQNECFDIIFADPPYDMEGVEQLPQMILAKNILNKGGLLVVEHSKKYDFSSEPNFEQMRKYGSVHFSFFTPLVII
ncbi:MAG: 16S rRNA (guanine(966)-N(2))-methyltransferase RsmD [Mucinivorans sp.]